MTEPKLQRLQAITFAENNGLIMRTFNVLENAYHPLSPTQKLLEGDGVSEAEFVTSVRFLSGEGYLELRKIGTGEAANIVDDGYATLEAIITTKKGMRLMMGAIKDDLIEV